MEQSQIKGSTTTYFKKSENKNIERISKYINLGVNSKFNVNDVAYVLNETEYNNLIDKANTDAVKQIAKLNETISELNKQITNLTDDKETLINTNNKLSNKLATYETQITELKQMNQQTAQENKTLTNQLNKYVNIDVDKLQMKTETLTDENKDLLINIKEMDKYIIYLEQLQTDYKELINYNRNKNFLTPLLNAIGLSDVVKPQLKHLDMKGHQLNKDNEPILTKATDTETNSE